VVADERLRAYAAGVLATGADALIVDEGPGATGETFDVVADWLRDVGAAEERLVLFPSRTWGMPLADAGRRARFAARRTYAPSGLDTRPVEIAARLGFSAPQDLSAGTWRHAVAGGGGLPADTVHERVKVRVMDDRGEAYLIRYCGMGSWGRAAACRATALAAQGFGPEVVAAADGFLVSRWVGGRPATRPLGRSRAFVATLATYLAARRPLFPVQGSVDRSPLIEMLCQNATEALGPHVDGLSVAAHCLERLPDRPAVVVDARLQPWEWLRTDDGYVKVDAVDHGDGLRLPGPADAAWDLAGAAVEHRLDDAAMAYVVSRTCAPGVRAAELAAAAAAYRAPYAAFALGQATLASWEAPAADDKQRLRRQAWRYRRALARELDRWLG
jgi:hypothetical protein